MVIHSFSERPGLDSTPLCVDLTDGLNVVVDETGTLGARLISSLVDSLHLAGPPVDRDVVGISRDEMVQLCFIPDVSMLASSAYVGELVKLTRKGLLGRIDLMTLRDLSVKIDAATRLEEEIRRSRSELATSGLEPESLQKGIQAAELILSRAPATEKSIADRERRIAELEGRLRDARARLTFFDYLRGMGSQEISAVKRSSERIKWLREDLAKHDAELELAAKRIRIAEEVVRKYDRLAPYLGQREMALDLLVDKVRKLRSELPEDRLKQLESERRVIRAQLRHWGRRRLLSVLLGAALLIPSWFWRYFLAGSSIAFLMSLAFSKEIWALRKKEGQVSDRYDYVTLEFNALTTKIQSAMDEISRIQAETHTRSAQDLHDKIEDYKRLLEELAALREKHSELARARAEVEARIREEEQATAAFLERVGLPTTIDDETISRFVQLISSKLDDERLVHDLTEDIDRESRELQKLRRELDSMNEDVGSICRSLGAASLDELRERFARSSSKGSATEVLRSKEEKLQSLLGGHSLEELRQRAEMLSSVVAGSSVTSVAPDVAKDELESRLEQLEGLESALAGDSEMNPGEAIRGICLCLDLLSSGARLPLIVQGDLSSLDQRSAREIVHGLEVAARDRQVIVSTKSPSDWPKASGRL